jgi:hypothetical protein
MATRDADYGSLNEWIGGPVTSETFLKKMFPWVEIEYIKEQTYKLYAKSLKVPCDVCHSVKNIVLIRSQDDLAWEAKCLKCGTYYHLDDDSVTRSTLNSFWKFYYELFPGEK